MRKQRIVNGLVISISVIICIVAIGLFALDYIKDDNKVSMGKTSIQNNKEKQEEEHPKGERRMSLVMVGDALIHGAVYNDALEYDVYNFKKMFTDIEPIISKYDLRYYNQESIIGGGLPQHYPLLNSPDEIGEDLLNIGFNLVSLANNHSFDKGEDGLLYSLDFWKNHEKQAHTSGSYSSFYERDDVTIYEQNGIKYAFLAYTVPTNGLSAPEGREYYVNIYSESQAKRDVQTARNKGAEVILVSMHWGEEYTHTPTEKQKEAAEFLSSLGVNVIIGSHPHVIQPMEFIGDTLVIYSLGNFISAQRELGEEKVVGLMVGTDIVVNDGKVKVDNTKFELLYTYYPDSLHGFKVIPFSKLTDEYLYDYENKNIEYRKIVDSEGVFDGNI